MYVYMPYIYFETQKLFLRSDSFCEIYALLLLPKLKI